MTSWRQPTTSKPAVSQLCGRLRREPGFSCLLTSSFFLYDFWPFLITMATLTWEQKTD